MLPPYLDCARQLEEVLDGSLHLVESVDPYDSNPPRAFAIGENAGDEGIFLYGNQNAHRADAYFKSFGNARLVVRNTKDLVSFFEDKKIGKGPEWAMLSLTTPTLEILDGTYLRSTVRRENPGKDRYLKPGYNMESASRPALPWKRVSGPEGLKALRNRLWQAAVYLEGRDDLLKKYADRFWSTKKNPVKNSKSEQFDMISSKWESCLDIPLAPVNHITTRILSHLSSGAR
jgi:hypothetical protein